MKKTAVFGILLVMAFTMLMILSLSSSKAEEPPTTEDVVTTVIESQSDSVANDETVIDVKEIMQDRVLGQADAPVTIIEYASMTCMHCANFHNEHLPAIKKELIETGKVRFIFREFPLDAIALRASMMVRCAPEDKFFGLLEVLFANQKRWVGAEDQIEAMGKIGKLAGLSEERFKACLANSDLEEALLKSRQNAAKKYSVNSTPSFVFNDGAAVESGVMPVERFKEIIAGLE